MQVVEKSDKLEITGSLSITGIFTSSLGSFGELSTFNNNAFGQSIPTPGTYVQITQWMTSSLASPTVTVLPSASNGQTNNSITITNTGMYLHNVSLSFSGSAGVYTFAVFINGVIDPDAVTQQTINVGQSFPRNVTLTHLDFHPGGSMVHDVRVACDHSATNFIMNYGNFNVLRVVG